MRTCYRPPLRSLANLLYFVGLLGGSSGGLRADEPAKLPLVFEDDFEKGASRWQATDAKAWKIIPLDGNPVYSLFQQSKYEPPHRSPLNFSLARDVSSTTRAISTT